ncbi:family 43 glycosylhydrolase [Demequina aestuarii]|uniref:family 43 glycosylhydrolase n=1 Tax=Demequina aestuarii TaxID=327095 RepID=UPI0007817C64|nr:family 43 glycosylhydrolase [Demequina aestuarii]
MHRNLPQSRPARVAVAALIGAVVATSLAGVSVASASPLEPLESELALHYDFAGPLDAATVADASGGGNDGTVVGSGASIVDGAIELTDDTFVEIPGEVFEGNDALTISAWLRNDMANSDYAALYFGNQTTPPTQYWLLNPANPQGNVKSVITNGVNATQPWTTEAGIVGPAAVDALALYTTVIRPTSITSYVDGERIGSVPVTRTVTDFGTDLIGYIGNSPYADPIWDGAVADLKVYTAAMTDQQAAAQYYEELGDPGTVQAAVDADAASLSVSSTVATDIELPTAGANGSEIAWTSSDPAIVATDGTVTPPPAADAVVTLTADLTLAGATAQRTFDVTVTSDASSTLLAHYDFSDSIGDGVVSDVSGNGNDAAVLGTGATVDTGAGHLTLPGGASGSGAGYVQMPTGMIDGQNTLTISAWLRNRTGSGDYAAMFFGTTQSPPLQYWLLNPQNGSGRFKSVIVDGKPSSNPWSLESGISPTSAARGIAGPLTAAGEWGLYTTVITPSSITGYYNDQRIGTVSTARTITQFGSDLVGYIGRSSYADEFYEGDVRDVQIYTSALTASQIVDAYYGGVDDPAVITAALTEDADALSFDSLTVADDVTLATTGDRGSQISWASTDLAVIAADGTVVRPATENAEVTLIATLALAGESTTRDFTFTVVADSPQANLEYAASQFDLGLSVAWQDIVLAADFAGYSVTWETSNAAAVTAAGDVSRGAAEAAARLTATLADGSLTAQREFDVTVLAEDAGWIGTAIGTGNTDDTDNLRLSASTDGADFAALNDGQGILFPELGSRKMGSPTAFRTPDGGFGLVSTLDSHSNQIFVFDSENLRAYSHERLVQFAPTAHRTARVAVGYDNGIAAYRLHYTNTADGLHYEVTTRDFAEFSAPAEVATAPSFVSASFPSGMIETDAIAVTAAEYDYVVDRLSRISHIGVEPFANLDIAKGDDPALPEAATVEYSNGTTARMPVDWDTSGVDFDTPGVYTIDGTIADPQYPSPLVERRADPDATLGDDGYYYFTGSYPMTYNGDPNGYDRIVLRRSATLEGLATATEVEIWNESSEAGLNSYIWAPELVEISGEWYVLFTAARSGGFDIRPALLKYTGGELAGDAALDPANWETVGYHLPAPGDDIAFNSFSLDMTHFEHNGVDYGIWAQSDAEGFSTMRMAPMDSANPQQMADESIQITRPTRAWEQASGVEVNEGAAVIKNDGKIIVAFSSASVDVSYNISVLWADEDADLMDPASWNKLGYPLLTTDDVPGMYGPGHNSFTVDALGNPVMVYHARSYDDPANPGEATDGGLFDPRRNAHATIVNFDVDGLPVLDLTPDEQLDPALRDVQVTVTVEPEEGLVAHYQLDETSGTVAEDSSGNGLDGTYVGGPTLGGDAGVRLDGAGDHVVLPDDLVGGLDSITVSTEVLVRSTQGGDYFIYGFGNADAGGVGDGYLMATGNPTLRGNIASGNWSTEQRVDSGAVLSRDVWRTVTYTLDDATDTSRLYLDGVEVAVNTTTTLRPSDIGGGATALNFIGRSVYTADGTMAGSVRDFRIYDSALDASAVAALVPTDAERVARDAAALNISGAVAITDDIDLPTAGANGSTIAWASSDPAVVGDDGTVSRPGYAEGDADVTLTATVTLGDETVTRLLVVTVLASADDQSIADAGAAALSVTNIDDVRGNLTLPTEIDGLPVTWSSADTGIITTDGIVNRPGSDTEVTLTATVTKGEATAVREFAAQVRAAVELDAFEGYAFSYFTGDSLAGEKIYFAASDGNDALSWDELNGGDPVLESEYGTRGLRDPFIIRSPEGDTFYMIATDLSIGSGGGWDASQRQGSQYLEVWESRDLVNWSEQRHVKVAPDNAGNLWAPEAYYDESIGAYVVFWASKLYPEDDPGHTANGIPNEMLYSTTRDFVTFSEPQGWQTGISRIDSTVLEVDGTYHRFTKDEGAGTTGCSDIIHEYSDQLRAPLADWDLVASCIGREAGTGAVEGPSIFTSNPGDVSGDYYYLFVDEYGGRGYIPLRTEDIADPDWQVAPEYDLPASPRHGTVIPVTAAELEALREGVVEAEPVTADADGQVLRYDFETGQGTTLTDVTGNGYDGTIVGGATLAGGEMAFDGSNDYVDLPDNILAGIEDVTIEAEVFLDQGMTGNYFIYGLGNTTGGAGDGYLFTTGNSQYRTSIATGNWSTEQTVGTGQTLPRGQWVQLVYTLSGTTATLYLDGVQVATGTVNADPEDIGSGFTSANHLGRSNYDADGLFEGAYREFALYNRALSAEEVLAASGETDVLLGVTLEDESVLKVDPIVDQTERTVVFPVEPGTDLTQLAPVFATVAGVTSDPASGTVRDLSTPATYQLGDDSTATWTMEAVEMRSPVLPGLYADPNIIAFGGTYYVYATSDGYPGWGGNEFYVWKSTDLVDWERSDEPFLTLDGEDGDVPWATGNAWAPTAIERDGKYYFYFSGHHAELNRKTIGVAVADHPEGPFVAEPEAMILNNEAVTSGQAIDPHAFMDPVSGTYYLYWGNGSPVMAQLADDMVSLEPGTIQVMTGLTGYREGSFMAYREGIYHLTYSIDDTGSENYRVGYATSDSAEGPWTYRGVILEKDASLGILGTGHNSVLNVPGTDDWYIAYHRFAIPDGNGTNRETTIDRLTFDEQTGLIETVTPTLSAVDAQEIVDQEPLSVSISGTAEPGEQLDAVIAEPWTAESYQWLRDGDPILGANAAGLVLADTDAGADISVEVTASKALWADATVTSDAVTVAELDGGGPGGENPGGETPGGETPAEGQLGVSAGTVRPGDTIAIWGADFTPGEQVTVTLYSTPTELRTVQAGVNGDIATTVTIPLDVAAGDHTLEAVGAQSGTTLSAGLTVLDAGQLATTGADGQWPLALLIAALLMGLGVTMTMRQVNRR